MGDGDCPWVNWQIIGLGNHIWFETPSEYPDCDLLNPILISYHNFGSKSQVQSKSIWRSYRDLFFSGNNTWLFIIEISLTNSPPTSLFDWWTVLFGWVNFEGAPVSTRNLLIIFQRAWAFHFRRPIILINTHMGVLEHRVPKQLILLLCW